MLGQIFKVSGEREVVREVLALESRIVPAPVVGREVVELAEASAQESAAERAEGDQGDAKLRQHWKQLVFRIAAEQGVLGLDCGDRMNLVRAAHGVR